jgi:hypothetical protein
MTAIAAAARRVLARGLLVLKLIGVLLRDDRCVGSIG